jgi:hypothetical protein
MCREKIRQLIQLYQDKIVRSAAFDGMFACRDILQSLERCKISLCKNCGTEIIICRDWFTYWTEERASSEFQHLLWRALQMKYVSSIKDLSWCLGSDDPGSNQLRAHYVNVDIFLRVDSLQITVNSCRSRPLRCLVLHISFPNGIIIIIAIILKILQ